MGGHGHGAHPDLAHHFESLDNQFAAGKLGMWLFLATEVLLFAGLFCAYTVYRATHPEVFEYASLFLDWKLGALNTMILLISSFTAAMAVRSAQLRDKGMTSLMLAITIACGGGFMVVKFFEYHHKWEMNELPGAYFNPANETDPPEEVKEALERGHAALAAHEGDSGALLLSDEPVAYAAVEPGAELRKGSLIPLAPERVAGDVVEAKEATPGVDIAKIRDRVHIFFGIYFCMTGLHGLHVLIGMIVLGWCLMRNLRGEFAQGYYLPVDLAALYWHLVDLIWIYLFPLLYLINLL